MAVKRKTSKYLKENYPEISVGDFQWVQTISNKTYDFLNSSNEMKYNEVKNIYNKGKNQGFKVYTTPNNYDFSNFEPSDRDIVIASCAVCASSPLEELSRSNFDLDDKEFLQLCYIIITEFLTSKSEYSQRDTN